MSLDLVLLVVLFIVVPLIERVIRSAQNAPRQPQPTTARGPRPATRQERNSQRPATMRPASAPSPAAPAPTLPRSLEEPYHTTEAAVTEEASLEASELLNEPRSASPLAVDASAPGRRGPLIASTEELRQAIVLATILEPCKALRNV